MGNWYKIVNLDKRESIDPGTIGLSIKWRSFTEPGIVPALLTVALFGGRWDRDRIAIVCDEADEGEPCQYHDSGLRDVTEEVLAEYNRNAWEPFIKDGA